MRQHTAAAAAQPAASTRAHLISVCMLRVGMYSKALPGFGIDAGGMPLRMIARWVACCSGGLAVSVTIAASQHNLHTGLPQTLLMQHRACTGAADLHRWWPTLGAVQSRNMGVVHALLPVNMGQQCV
jgi:hypothetical protein